MLKNFEFNYDPEEERKRRRFPQQYKNLDHLMDNSHYIIKTISHNNLIKNKSIEDATKWNIKNLTYLGKEIPSRIKAKQSYRKNIMSIMEEDKLFTEYVMKKEDKDKIYSNYFKNLNEEENKYNKQNVLKIKNSIQNKSQLHKPKTSSIKTNFEREMIEKNNRKDKFAETSTFYTTFFPCNTDSINLEKYNQKEIEKSLFDNINNHNNNHVSFKDKFPLLNNKNKDNKKILVESNLTSELKNSSNINTTTNDFHINENDQKNKSFNLTMNNFNETHHNTTNNNLTVISNKMRNTSFNNTFNSLNKNIRFKTDQSFFNNNTFDKNNDSMANSNLDRSTISFNRYITRMSSRPKVKMGDLLNIDYSSLEKKKNNIKVPEIKNLWEEVNHYGPNFAYCNTCFNKNLFYFENVNKNDGINVLNYIKKEKFELKNNLVNYSKLK